MKVGEVWSDKEDGEKVKIKDISYGYVAEHLLPTRREKEKDYIIYIESLDGSSGYGMASENFLIQYEKCYGK